MKRILFVHHGKGIGGAPLTLLTILRTLDRKQFTPSVLCLYESEAAGLFRKKGIETHIGKGIYHLAHTTGVWYPLLYFPALFVRLLLFPVSVWNAYRFLAHHSVDLVHLNSSSLLAVAIAARIKRLPVIIHVLEHLHQGYFGIRRFLLARLLLAFSEALVFICNADARMFPESAKIHVVYDSIDPEQFDADKVDDSLKSTLGIPPEAPVVGMFGGIHPIKGTMEFVRAAEAVARQLPNAHFLILGVKLENQRETRSEGFIQRLKTWLSEESRYRNRVLTLAGKEFLKNKIHMLEPTVDVPPIVKILDILAFPSTVPHYARPLIEAAFMKKPVIASRIEGPEEIVVDGVTGLFVPPGNSDDLAQSIIKLLRDNPLRQALGIAGFERANQMFNAKKNVQRIIDLYSVLDKNVDGSK